MPYKNPSPLLGELLGAGMLRVDTDGLTILAPDGSVFAEKSPPVTISPDGGAFGSTDVTLACPDPDAAIFYSVDGSEPTENSTLYSGPFAMVATGTVKAVALRVGFLRSEVASADFVINGQVATPDFDPPAGEVVSGTEITVTCATDGAEMFYTLNGGTPTRLSTPYTVPIAITGPKTIKVLAVLADFDDSDVGSAAYTIAP